MKTMRKIMALMLGMIMLSSTLVANAYVNEDAAGNQQESAVAPQIVQNSPAQVKMHPLSDSKDNTTFIGYLYIYKTGVSQNGAPICDYP